MTQREEQTRYYRLCELAESYGVPTSLDNPESPRTIAALEDAISARITADRFPSQAKQAQLIEEIRL